MMVGFILSPFINIFLKLKAGLLLDDEQKKELSPEAIAIYRHAAVCRQLAKEAVRKQSGDNVTVMLIMIEHKDC